MRKSYLKITFGLITAILLLSASGWLKQVSASTGQIKFYSYIVLDGLLSPSTKMPGVVIWIPTPIHKDLFNKKYDPRGGTPELFVVTDNNGYADMRKLQGNVKCNYLGTPATSVCNMQIYGNTAQGIRFGGLPSSQAVLYGGKSDSTACTTTSKKIGNATFYEDGYVGEVQCATAIYDQCPGVKKSSSELYRFVPYLPKGWKDVYGSNFPIQYNPNDPKGGGYFFHTNDGTSYDNTSETTWRSDKKAISITTINFPNSTQTTYYGTTDHPFITTGNQKKIIPRGSGTGTGRSESAYLTDVGNGINKYIRFYWYPVAATPTPTPSPSPSVSPSPSPTPSVVRSQTPYDVVKAFIVTDSFESTNDSASNGLMIIGGLITNQDNKFQRDAGPVLNNLTPAEIFRYDGTRYAYLFGTILGSQVDYSLRESPFINTQ